MEAGDIYWAEVVSAGEFGAFLKWKPEKDILVPHREQLEEMRAGEERLIIVCYEQAKDRYFGSERISAHLLEEVELKELEIGEFTPGQKIQGIVYGFSPLGIKIAFAQKYTGLLFESDVIHDVALGEELELYIKQIREDGKVDLMMRKQGYKNVIDNHTTKILTKLQRAGGSLPYGDRSKPEDIQDNFQMSKSSFKQAIGALYKQRKIAITPQGIELMKATSSDKLSLSGKDSKPRRFPSKSGSQSKVPTAHKRR